MTELLSPAGTLKSMRYAFAYGADAVYAGQPRYSLRVRNNDFLNENLALGIAEAHSLRKKFYLTTNLLPHNSKVRTFIKDLEEVIAMGPDALIIADPGILMMVKERWPDMPLHLSVQANTLNYAAVKFWQRAGIERIILSRELSLKEIEEIRQQCPDIELEVFVHGALCIAYSGRCLLSGYFNHRDPNQGACTNACRWEYSTRPSEETAEGVHKVISGEQILNNPGIGKENRHPLADDVYLLEETNRPGELMPVMEDEHGTYIMNSKDLRAVEHIEKLVNIGIDCVKIEGRTKSHYYAARTAQIYRQAIDDASNGNPFDTSLIGKLENLANRGYTDGFYKRHHSKDQQSYMQGISRSNLQNFVGEVTNITADFAEVAVKNRFEVGDKLELITPTGNKDITLDAMQDLEGNPVDAAPGSGHTIRLPVNLISAEKGLIARYI